MALALVHDASKQLRPVNPSRDLRRREAQAWLHLLITAGNRDKSNPEPLLKRPKGE